MGVPETQNRREGEGRVERREGEGRVNRREGEGSEGKAEMCEQMVIRRERVRGGLTGES